MFFAVVVKGDSCALICFVFVCFSTIYVSACDEVEFAYTNGFCIYMFYHYLCFNQSIHKTSIYP